MRTKSKPLATAVLWSILGVMLFVMLSAVLQAGAGR